MKIVGNGCTRIVILTEKCAIKIARFPFVHLVQKGMAFIFSPGKRSVLNEKHGNMPITAFKNRVFAGVKANRNEYRYSASHDDPRVMPVVKQLFGGLVIIQQKGTPVSPREIDKEGLAIAGQDHELERADQFCRNPATRQVVIIDFGEESTIKLLESTLAFH